MFLSLFIRDSHSFFRLERVEMLTRTRPDNAFDRFHLDFDFGKVRLLVYFVKLSSVFYHLLLLTANWVIFILP